MEKNQIDTEIENMEHQLFMLYLINACKTLMNLCEDNNDLAEKTLD